jgi:hypothetical protein
MGRIQYKIVTLLLELPCPLDWPQAHPNLGSLYNVVILKDGESFYVF